MEEKGIVGARILDRPMHCSQNIRFCRLAHGILLIVGKEHHIFPGVAEVLIKIRRHILDIVNTSTKLSLLTKIVDSDQQRFPLSCAARILEVVALGCTMAKRDRI